MNIVDIELSKLIGYENNPRKNDAAVDAVAESIKQFGFKVPIIIDKDYVIVAGHTRKRAAEKLGLETAPCIIADDLTPEQIKAFRVADNKTAELADWDFDKLEAEMKELQEMNLDFSMADFGFDLSEFEEEKEVEEDDFDVDEEIATIVDPVTKLGDVWKLGRHYLMCGDSTKAEDVEKLMNGEKADLLLTDPPYNVALGMGGSVDEARKRHRRTDGLVIMNDKMEDSEFYQFLVKCYSCGRDAMKEGASFYIWHADNEGLNFRAALKESGLTLRQTLIWNKNTITLGRQDYQWKHEPCLYGWKDGASHHWYSDRCQSTVLDFKKPSKSEDHPTMKPIELFDYQIKNSTKKGDIVLDLFGGSGTTIIACEQNNRVGYSMELDPKYCDVIISRWERLTGQKAEKIC